MMRALFAGSLGAILLFACSSDDATATPCKDIPDGGCPLSHGIACEDPSCAAVYACINGSWSFDHACPAREGGAPVDAGVSDAADASSSFRDVSIDAPPGAFGGPGCPDLQPPDCPLGVALECPQQSACCGCDDLYVCQNGGWVAWGRCVDGGVSQ